METPNKLKIINDPVFGFIKIPSELIYDLLQHPYMLRLTRIKQLGLTSYVYPGTQHTRFQHSLGALFLMTQAVAGLRSKGVEISDEEADGVYAAITLHDIGHGPFSHTLEDSFFTGVSHEDIGLAVINRLNAQMDGRLDIAIAILKDVYPKKFLHELVSGQLDMDRLDYLRRDSFFSGVSEGNIGSARIIKMLDIKDGKLVVEAKGIYSIENFLMSRRLMYWQVYFHKTAYAAERMLHNTIARAKLLRRKGKSLFAPGSLDFFLRDEVREPSDEALDCFMDLDDSDIWTSLKAWRHCGDKVLEILSAGILDRRLFKMQIGNNPVDSGFVDATKAEIARKFGLPPADAEFLTAQGSVSQHIYKNSEADIEIVYNNREVKTVQEASDMLDMKVLGKEVTKYYFCYYRV